MTWMFSGWQIPSLQVFFGVPWFQSPSVPPETINLEVFSQSGLIFLQWDLPDGLTEDSQLFVFRKDGELGIPRKLNPSGLPEYLIEYTDWDVLSGVEYEYFIEVWDTTLVAKSPKVKSFSLPPSESTLKVVPLTWIADIPVGGSGEIDIYLEGKFQFSNPVEFSLNDVLWEKPPGISVEIERSLLYPPGVLSVNILADLNSSPGIYPIPIQCKNNLETLDLWLFARNHIPFGTATLNLISIPATSRSLGIHTDSQLREDTENILVIKGELGAIKGNTKGTGIVAQLDIGSGQIIEQTDKVANANKFSTSISLPPLDQDTVVKAKVTWLGSSTSPGGSSPLLYLPVGGYSVGSLKQSAKPEPAILIMGENPQDIDSPPTDDDLLQIMESAQKTLIDGFY